MTHSAPPPITWHPTNPTNTQMFRFAHWLTDTHAVDLGQLLDDDGNIAPGLYRRLHAWSITELPAFWDAVREYFGVLGDGFDTDALTDATMPGAVWYPNAQVNFAENVLERTRKHVADDATALVNIDENNVIGTVTWQQLRTRVHGLAEQLRDLGVQPGDRIAAVLPNNAQAIIGLLASATIGAVWTINSPDLTVTATLARLRQLAPTVLITSGGYTFAGKFFDLTEYNAQLRAGLPSLNHHLSLEDYRQAPTNGPVDYLRVAFDHPLWILFSSGTTGDPKGIVHGHGGMLLESLKGQGLHQDMTPTDRYYVAANTSWMVWNTLVQALALGTSVVVYGGSPKINGPARQFEVIAATDTTRFAVGAPYLSLVERSGTSPAEHWDLTGLKSILSTAAPLPESTWRWVHEHVNPAVRLGSDSGGTDICSGFIGTNPLEPIRLGELQGPMLGVAAKSFDDDGQEVFDEVGELVMTEPMPSMPLYLWNDPDGERYRDTYFDRFRATDIYPHGVWAQGDWVIQTSRGSFIVEGRSDATLNRQGVRLGTAEIYAALSHIPEVEQSTVIGVEQPGGSYWMPLFVQLAEGAELTDELQDRIAEMIRTQASVRHVPDEIIAVADIPVTHSGKRIEVPLKKLFIRGTADAVNQDAIANPGSLAEFVELAQRRAMAS